ncbi:MAG: hypothetical protein ACTTGJ_01935 [Clostridium sp.]
MRIRRKKWAEEELKASPIYLDGNEKLSGKWKEKVIKDNNLDISKENINLIIEIGMGKGKFISNLAYNDLKLSKESKTNNESKNKQNFYIGIDMIEAMLGLAKREIEEVYLNIDKSDRKILNDYFNKLNYYMKFKEQKEYIVLKEELNNNSKLKDIYNKIMCENLKRENFKNIYILNTDAEKISEYFDKSDNVSRIYLNFSNPWPKDKHNKRRLTYIDKLEKYKEFLKKDGLILFKTDDLNFFNDSLEYFKKTNLKILAKTNNLDKEDIYFEILGEKNIETEHEQMFKQKGILINAVILQKK